MTYSASIWKKVHDLVAPLSPEERLELIQAIAALTPVPQDGELDDRRSQLAEEQTAWYAKPASERVPYRGQFVAVRGGEVVDHDPDQRELYVRVRAQFGHSPVLIVPAEWTEPPTYTIRSPRLEQ
jgi:hypothetical protein